MKIIKNVESTRGQNGGGKECGYRNGRQIREPTCCSAFFSAGRSEERDHSKKTSLVPRICNYEVNTEAHSRPPEKIQGRRTSDMERIQKPAPKTKASQAENRLES